MDRIKISRPVSITPFSYGHPRSYPIDQSAAQDFMINPLTGFPYNDITLIIKANTVAESEAMLERLPQFKKEFLETGISDLDAIEYYKPRSCQSASEIADLNERLVSRALKDRQKAIEEKELSDLFASNKDVDNKDKKDS